MVLINRNNYMELMFEIDFLHTKITVMSEFLILEAIGMKNISK